MITFITYKVLSKIRFREVFRILANKEDANWIKTHDVWKLIDPYALQDFKKVPFFKELKNLGSGFGCMFINLLALISSWLYYGSCWFS